MESALFLTLQCALTIASFLALVLVLAAQGHEEEHESRRDLLLLELALLAERKTAKLIALLEELRRDLSLVHDRHNTAAHGMSAPADPGAVLGFIRQELYPRDQTEPE